MTKNPWERLRDLEAMNEREEAAELAYNRELHQENTEAQSARYLEAQYDEYAEKLRSEIRLKRQSAHIHLQNARDSIIRAERLITEADITQRELETGEVF